TRRSWRLHAPAAPARDGAVAASAEEGVSAAAALAAVAAARFSAGPVGFGNHASHRRKVVGNYRRFLHRAVPTVLYFHQVTLAVGLRLLTVAVGSWPSAGEESLHLEWVFVRRWRIPINKGLFDLKPDKEGSTLENAYRFARNSELGAGCNSSFWAGWLVL